MIAIVFPHIDPVAISFMGFSVHWYALSYVVGIVLGYQLIKHLNHRYATIPEAIYDDLIFYIVLGIIIGGRLGYVIFYDLGTYLSNPIEILKTYKGGMSFHGGLAGVGIACYLLARKYHCSFLSLIDYLAIAAPIGIFLGRIANFINRELNGRITDLSWGVKLSIDDQLARHPSQLYEALSEGLLLFIIMLIATLKTDKIHYRGWLCGLFLCLYGLFRGIVENFREPDAQIGYIFTYFTLGQILCIPLIMLGTYLIYNSKKTLQS